MQIPYRKPGEFTHLAPDPNMTQAKYDELTAKLKKLKAALPKAISELQRLAEMGDFSENAAYQMAKARVRHLNDKIHEIGEHLKQAVIIKRGNKPDRVELGSRVTVRLNNKEKTYQILGSSEVNLEKNIISNHSPVGAALMGRQAGEKFTARIGDKNAACEIISIE